MTARPPTSAAPQPPGADAGQPGQQRNAAGVLRRLERQLGGALSRRGLRPLVLVDLVGLLGIMVVLNLLRFGRPTAATYPLWQYALAFLLAALVHVVVGYFGGLYERELRLGSRPQLPRVAGMALIGMLFVALAELLLGRYYLPRQMLLVLPVCTALLLAGTRRLARGRRLRRHGPPRALLVGAPDDVNLARAHLAERNAPAVVVGATSSGRDLSAKVAATGATDVLLLSGTILDEVYPEPLTTLERRGVGVLQRIAARDTLLGLSGLREIAGMPFVALRTHALPVNRARFKRCLELGGLLLVAPVLLPLTALVAIYVLVVAGRPVLYRQQRTGLGGRPFTMVKFRTMGRDAEHGLGPVLAATADPRVIPACRWLRATRVDELPQLWNVLRGEMSVVGPRPERPELTAQYERLIPGYARRHEIPPGITGLAQISGRYHTDPEYKLGHDLQYLVNWSPVLDLQILGRTLLVVLTGRT